MAACQKTEASFGVS